MQPGRELQGRNELGGGGGGDSEPIALLDLF